MPILSFSYLDIPPAKRRESASRALARLREHLNDPLTSPERILEITKRIEHLELWSSGTLNIPEGT